MPRQLPAGGCSGRGQVILGAAPGWQRGTEERFAGTPVRHLRACELLPELQPARSPTGFARVAVLHQLLHRLRFLHRRGGSPSARRRDRQK